MDFTYDVHPEWDMGLAHEAVKSTTDKLREYDSDILWDKGYPIVPKYGGYHL